MNEFTRRTALGALSALPLLSVPVAAGAVGNGPSWNGNGNITTAHLSTYDDVAAFLQKEAQKQPAMELSVIGQSVKGRDLYLASWLSAPENPTVLFLTQQHGNEQLTTEGALEVVKHLGTGRLREVLDGVNILIVPMLNPDGAMGDVDFSLEGYLAHGDRHLTRYNAVEADLNRDHVDRLQPETQALHENVLGAFEIDYMIDLHHQGANRALGDELVSGSILHPTTPNAAPELVERSKRLGSVVYDAVDSTGWGLIGKYNGGSAETISRNGLAVEYDIATLLFEMRGMSDHTREDYVLGARSSGYLIRQTVLTLEATVRAIADGSIESADISFWDTLPTQETYTPDE
ncbi:M14 family zinc carboxypeptidase [Brachybacterium saurashtrense]|uniref:Carboxypeptidase n=1 Tax=Brachybacterium saurashtrense TaxID=556288 RepID=A0A345YS47_9MICO|nr:M14 family zinc carboxypeptidase [Brachybacterium saurashtrense]AXK46749.1 carboxypeptidase [Brachybacterium saurashtrense]RRR22464.1 carboxypeptidase [Brachybacterium saurashtrense]